jgi:dephospho-CoA kinase
VRNVAIFGQMAAGKSTIAAALVEAGYHRMSFAAPLKNVAALAYGKVGKSDTYRVTALDGTVSEISGREVLQRVGQSIKAHDRDFWLQCFLRDSANYLDTALVVDDGRFLFERDALRAKGWLIVGVNTSHSVRMQRYETLYGRVPTEAEQNHQSEVEVPTIVQEADLILQGTDDPYWTAKKILDKAR